jgi:hypothetical protein
MPHSSHLRCQVWARAQGLEAEPDGINGFLLSMLAVHLTDKGTLVGKPPSRICVRHSLASKPDKTVSSEVGNLCAAQTAAMTPLQLMRACIAALAKGATFAKGLVMARQQPSEAAQSAPPHAAAFRQHHSLVWVDPSGHLNLAAHVQPSALAQVCDSIG